MRMNADRQLDCRRMDGSRTVREAGKALASLRRGEVLVVVATDPGSVADVAAFSRSTGHEILDQSAGGGEYRILIRKA